MANEDDQAQVSAHDRAVQDREAAAKAVAAWLSDKAQAELALAEALERSGELILDDPAQLDKLGQSIDSQRTRIAMGDRAVGEASRRYMAAAREALRMSWSLLWRRLGRSWRSSKRKRRS